MASVHQRRRLGKHGGGVSTSAWPDLPRELLERVAALLGPLDRVAVRLVCSAWRAAMKDAFSPGFPFEPPRLLLRRGGGDLAFFSLGRREFLPFALPARLRRGRCCGHRAGWLAMAFDDDRAISLSNPVSGGTVALPPPPVGPVGKIILSSPPTSPGFVAAALGLSGTIALFSPASTPGAWMTLDEGAKAGGFRDMAFWRGRLCALGHDGTILAFQTEVRARLAVVSVLRAPPAVAAWPPRYLVESEGELLHVERVYHGNVVWAEVLRFEGHEWKAVEGLGGRALFVGAVQSEAVPAAQFELSGIEEGGVYFARRKVDMLVPHVIGMFSMEDRCTYTVPIPGEHSVDVEPVWISPFV